MTVCFTNFGDILNNQTGKLRIGIAFTRGHAIMPELIAAFQKEYPGVDVELVESSNDVLQKVPAGRHN